MLMTREATIVRAGRRFIGHFRVAGAGAAASVVVRYKTTVICGRKGHLPEEEVAQALLGDLIQETLAERRRRHH